MKKHSYGLITPIISIIYLVSLLVIWSVFLFIDGIPQPERILIIMVPVTFICVSIFVLFYRIKEMRDSHKDDLETF